MLNGGCQKRIQSKIATWVFFQITICLKILLSIFSLSGYSEVINERESQLSKSKTKDAKGMKFYLLSELIIKEMK